MIFDHHLGSESNWDIMKPPLILDSSSNLVEVSSQVFAAEGMAAELRYMCFFYETQVWEEFVVVVVVVVAQQLQPLVTEAKGHKLFQIETSSF